MLNDEKRTVEEAYCSATQSSNLRVEADRRGDADILIAAGWSMSRIGAALLRLHSEFDGVEHPRTATAADFKGDKKAAHAHNLHETGLMLGRLKSLPGVREQVAIQAQAWGAADPQTVAAEVVRWWLSQVCQECHGTKFEHVPGTGRLSAKQCKACRGSGLAPVPGGDLGKRLANWLDECVHAGRDGIKKRLRNIMDRG